MRNFLASLLSLVWQTIRAPRRVAERIIALDLPVRTLWDGLLLSVLVTVILIVGLVLATPTDPADPGGVALREIYARPIPVAIGQLINSVTTVFAILWIGRWLGGHGRLEGAIALVAWHQVFLLCMALAGMVVGAIFPAGMTIMLLVLLALYFYVLTQFICALHGFDNAALVLVGLVASMFGILVAVSLMTGLLSMIFLGAPANV